MAKFLALVSSLCIVMACGGGSNNGGGAESNDNNITIVASGNVADGGGTVEVTDPDSTIYGTKVQIPNGVLSEHQQITIGIVENPEAMAADYFMAGNEFIRFGPDGAQFRQKAILRLPYNDLDNDGRVDGTSFSERNVTAMFFDAQTHEWVDLVVLDRNLEKNTIGVAVNQFSMFCTVVDVGTPKRRLINYFKNLSPEKKILSGQFVGFAYQATENYDHYINLDGKSVAMVGTDYGYSFSDEDLNATTAKLSEHWSRGGVVSISWHAPNPWDCRIKAFECACTPSVADGCSFCGDPKDMPPCGSADNGDGASSNETEFAVDNWNRKFNALVQALDQPDEGGDSVAAQVWIKQLSLIAEQLEALQDSGVVVLWRPFHEMNGAWFWWGQRDKSAFVKLWRHMYHYLTTTSKLKNLIWVYSPNQGPLTIDYYPGDDYVDIIGLDKYTIDNSAIVEIELANMGKPFGFGEFGPCGPEDGDPCSAEGYTQFFENYQGGISYFQAWDLQWSLSENFGGKELLNNLSVLTLADLDADKDGVHLFRDNCQSVSNPQQQDSDNDGLGDLCDPADPSLKVYYSFDDNLTGEFFITDESGNGNHLVDFIGAVSAKSGYRGNAVNFGTTMIRTDNGCKTGFKYNHFSVAFWYKHLNRNFDMGNADPGSELLLYSSAGYEMKIDNNEQTLTVNAIQKNDAWLPIADTPSPFKQWVFIALTFDGRTFSLYKNGEPPVTAVHPDSELVPQSSDCLILGAFETGHSSYRGLIDEFKIYDRVLSDEEIEKLYRILH